MLVRFDRTPVRVVFWRGSRYSPAWVSDKDQWMADQSAEAWKTGTEDTDGCFEHMQDRLCRYSHVRVIESHDARTVVHCRYAPVSSQNNLWNVDEKTGRACWVDEYYTIYPDAIGVRKPTWKTGTLGRPRQFQESLPFTHPDQYNNEVVEKDFCTVQAADRPTHFLGFPISSPPTHEKDGRSWWNGIYGMTDLSMKKLVTVARSWNYPPRLEVSDNLEDRGYDRHAYSHSTSVGRRYLLSPSNSLILAMNSCTSSCEMFSTGLLKRPPKDDGLFHVSFLMSFNSVRRWGRNE